MMEVKVISLPETAFLDSTTIPREDDVYEVWALCYGSGQNQRVHDNFIRRDMHDGPMPLDYFLWVVRNANRTILVDTGMRPEASVQRGRPIDFDPVEGLERIGIVADSVSDIVITHLHWDHAGNIHRFANARLHLQETEIAFATGRCMCDALHRYPFDVEDVVTVVRKTYADRVTFHCGDGDFLPGTSLHVFPGHSPGVQGVRVNTARGPILLASDAAHYFANVLHRKPFIVTVDTRDTLASYTKLMKVAGGMDRLVPGHDPKIRRYYPACIVNGVELIALHETPDPIDLAELGRFDDF
ncbi:N-acyl homoserine lactonase family protein [Paracoccus pantotrophus]|uniref:N-acyl homoserine lactonase family protein n=1 Tax=Paracoccus pantotrophus TaxID=82367 RepID=UPI0004B5265C|nr:N-acyl homoserine lactonase family protein [Paracoccus pantotrophus]